MKQIWTNLLLKILVLVEICCFFRGWSVAAGCTSGWFGTTCQYKCHCTNDDCDDQGECQQGSRCELGWFGPACQYVDLFAKESTTSIPWLSDGNDETCNSDITDNSVTVILSRPFLLTWLRLTVNEPDLLQTFDVLFRNSADGDDVLCDMSITPVDRKTLDIHIDCTDTIQQVILNGEGVKALCGLYISGGIPFASGISFASASVEDHATSDDDQATGVGVGLGVPILIILTVVIVVGICCFLRKRSRNQLPPGYDDVAEIGHDEHVYNMAFESDDVYEVPRTDMTAATTSSFSPNTRSKKQNVAQYVNTVKTGRYNNIEEDVTNKRTDASGVHKISDGYIDMSGKSLPGTNRTGVASSSFLLDIDSEEEDVVEYASPDDIGYYNSIEEGISVKRSDNLGVQKLREQYENRNNFPKTRMPASTTSRVSAGRKTGQQNIVPYVNAPDISHNINIEKDVSQGRSETNLVLKLRESYEKGKRFEKTDLTAAPTSSVSADSDSKKQGAEQCVSNDSRQENNIHEDDLKGKPNNANIVLTLRENYEKGEHLSKTDKAGATTSELTLDTGIKKEDAVKDVKADDSVHNNNIEKDVSNGRSDANVVLKLRENYEKGKNSLKTDVAAAAASSVSADSDTKKQDAVQSLNDDSSHFSNVQEDVSKGKSNASIVHMLRESYEKGKPLPKADTAAATASELTLDTSTQKEDAVKDVKADDSGHNNNIEKDDSKDRSDASVVLKLRENYEKGKTFLKTDVAAAAASNVVSADSDTKKKDDVQSVNNDSGHFSNIQQGVSNGNLNASIIDKLRENYEKGGNLQKTDTAAATTSKLSLGTGSKKKDVVQHVKAGDSGHRNSIKKDVSERVSDASVVHQLRQTYEKGKNVPKTDMASPTTSSVSPGPDVKKHDVEHIVNGSDSKKCDNVEEDILNRITDASVVHKLREKYEKGEKNDRE